MNEKELTTHCGIYCGDCPRYQAGFSDMSGELLEEFEKSNFSKLAEVIATKNEMFKQYPDMITLLQIIRDLKCDVSCRQGGGLGESCGVIKCNREKDIEGCWDCGAFEHCDKLDFLKPFCHDAPIKNLKKIKKLGVERWVSQRENQYPWL